MTMKPTLAFTIPSLRDETVLDCRIYIPNHLLDVAAPSSSLSVPATPDSDTRRGRRGNGGTPIGNTSHTGNGRRDGSRKKAAIIAHPYAPLGGSSDDYIVQEVAGEMLKQGFVVGLFNFRGAASSKGRTSWSAKSEADDYISFAGFMAVFMHHLNLRSAYSDPEVFDSETYELATIPSHTPTDPFTSSTISPANLFHATRDLGSSTADNLPERPLLILAGYSYGSLVTTLLPPLPTLLIPFQSPNHGSTASEIRLRAQHLAESQNALHTARVRHASETRSRRRLAASRNLTTGMRVGGEETSPDVRRASHEAHRGRRSLGLDRLEHSEWGRRSIDRVRSLRRSMDGSRLRSLSPSRASHHASHSKKSRSSSSFAEDRRAVVAGSKEEASTDSATVDPTMKANMPMPSLEFGELDVAYLLISPIQGVIGGLATMFSTTPASALLPSLPFSHRKRSHCEPTAHGARERKFVGNKTLVMFGDKDGFSNVERMRRWTQRLEGVQGSKLSAVEVKDGGHFWHSERELELLKSRVRQWVAELEYE